MKPTLITLFIVLLSDFAYSQTDLESYKKHVHKADSLYAAKEYKASAAEYKKAFDALDGKAYARDRYNAACTYALAGNAERAFYHLFYSAESQKTKYSNYNHLLTDPDLVSLHSEEKWKELLVLVKANKDEAEKDLDKELVAILDTVYREDQKYRMQLSSIEEKYGRDSKELKDHWKLISDKDSVNLLRVKKILDERGWLGPNVIGGQGNSTLFLVIQHSDLETQEKYLPMMREAVKNKNAHASSLALLEDRIALRKGDKQIYGSQIGRDQESGEYYVLPLIDPDNVNKRRAEVGLGTIENYIKNWGMTWDVEVYKKKLPEYIEMQKGR